jgi:hypothetical protein
MQNTRLLVISSLLLLTAFVPSVALAQTARSNTVSTSVVTTTSTTSTGSSCPSATAASSTLDSVKLPATVCVVDSFGNIYSLTVSGTRSSYSIRGQLVSSPYLYNTPWSVYGKGSGASFSWLSVDPVSSNGDCNWHISATITPPTASGTWANLGCSHESGALTFAECSATSCITGTSDGLVAFGEPGA